MSYEQIRPKVSSEYHERSYSVTDYTLLGIAILIDFATAIPFQLTGLGIIVALPLMAAEAFFLKSLGVPPIKSVFGALWDFIPIVDIMPWCIMAVLDKRFGVKIPYVTRLFNH